MVYGAVELLYLGTHFKLLLSTFCVPILISEYLAGLLSLQQYRLTFTVIKCFQEDLHFKESAGYDDWFGFNMSQHSSEHNTERSCAESTHVQCLCGGKYISIT